MIGGTANVEKQAQHQVEVRAHQTQTVAHHPMLAQLQEASLEA